MAKPKKRSGAAPVAASAPAARATRGQLQLVPAGRSDPAPLDAPPASLASKRKRLDPQQQQDRSRDPDAPADDAQLPPATQQMPPGAAVPWDLLLTQPHAAQQQRQRQQQQQQQQQDLLVLCTAFEFLSALRDTTTNMLALANMPLQLQPVAAAARAAQPAAAAAARTYSAEQQVASQQQQQHTWTPHCQHSQHAAAAHDSRYHAPGWRLTGPECLPNTDAAAPHDAYGWETPAAAQAPDAVQQHALDQGHAPLPTPAAAPHRAPASAVRTQHCAPRQQPPPAWAAGTATAAASAAASPMCISAEKATPASTCPTLDATPMSISCSGTLARAAATGGCALGGGGPCLPDQRGPRAASPIPPPNFGVGSPMAVAAGTPGHLARAGHLAQHSMQPLPPPGKRATTTADGSPAAAAAAAPTAAAGPLGAPLPDGDHSSPPAPGPTSPSPAPRPAAAAAALCRSRQNPAPAAGQRRPDGCSQGPSAPSPPGRLALDPPPATPAQQPAQPKEIEVVEATPDTTGGAASAALPATAAAARHDGQAAAQGQAGDWSWGVHASAAAGGLEDALLYCMDLMEGCGDSPGGMGRAEAAAPPPPPSPAPAPAAAAAAAAAAASALPMAAVPPAAIAPGHASPPICAPSHAAAVEAQLLWPKEGGHPAGAPAAPAPDTRQGPDHQRQQQGAQLPPPLPPPPAALALAEGASTSPAPAGVAGGGDAAAVVSPARAASDEQLGPEWTTPGEVHRWHDEDPAPAAAPGAGAACEPQRDAPPGIRGRGGPLSLASQTQSPLVLSEEVGDLAFWDPPGAPHCCESFPFQKDAMVFADWCNAAGAGSVKQLQLACGRRNFGSFADRWAFMRQQMQALLPDQGVVGLHAGSSDRAAAGDGEQGAAGRPQQQEQAMPGIAADQAAPLTAAAAAAAAAMPRSPRGPGAAAAGAAAGGGGAVGGGSPAAGWVRVFTEEYPGRNGYTRRFLAASYQSLWRRIRCTPEAARHFYEVIREAQPCHLYFDLEFSRAANPGLDGGVLVRELCRLMCEAFDRLWGLRLCPQWLLELDSSTADKFSRHLLVRVPNRAFPSNTVAGHLVQALVGTPAAQRTLYVQRPGCPAAAPAAAAAAGDVMAQPARHARDVVCFVDPAVYSRNRHFRMLGSSKGGKPAVLWPTTRFALSAAGHNPSLLRNHQLWLLSLVSNVAPGAEPLLLGGAGPLPRVVRAHGACAAAAGRHQQELVLQYPEDPALGPPVMGHQAPAVPPDVAAAVAAAAAARGAAHAPGYRAIKVTWSSKGQEQGPEAAAAAAAGATHLQQLAVGAIRYVEQAATEAARGLPALVRTLAYCGEGHCVSYSLIGPGSHACARVGRCHRSNHVFYVLDLDSGHLCQKCHDPDCANWRSRWQPLPLGLLRSPPAVLMGGAT